MAQAELSRKSHSDYEPWIAYEQTPHQVAMVEACKHGHLAKLQALFGEHGIQFGDDPLGFGKAYQKVTPDGAPRTADLFAPAISNGHQPIIRYLHLVYPNYDFFSYTIVGALLDNPDVDILKLIYSYAPHIIKLNSLDVLGDSPLGKACEGGPYNAPFINFLLDHGATDGGEDSYLWRFGGALNPAVRHHQSIQIIKRMIPLTDHLDYPIMTALDAKRADVLDLLLQADLARQRCPSLKEAERWLQDAQAMQDKHMADVMERHAHRIRRKVDGAEKAKKSILSHTGNVKDSKSTSEGKRTSKFWWQSHTQAQPGDEVSDMTTSGSRSHTASAKTWWPFSKAENPSKSAELNKHEKELDDPSTEEDILKPSEMA